MFSLGKSISIGKIAQKALDYATNNVMIRSEQDQKRRWRLMPLNTVEELVADIRAGKMVILMDDEDRENEGDLVIAATHVRP